MPGCLWTLGNTMSGVSGVSKMLRGNKAKQQYSLHDRKKHRHGTTLCGACKDSHPCHPCLPHTHSINLDTGSIAALGFPAADPNAPAPFLPTLQHTAHAHPHAPKPPLLLSLTPRLTLNASSCLPAPRSTPLSTAATLSATLDTHSTGISAATACV